MYYANETKALPKGFRESLLHPSASRGPGFSLTTFAAGLRSLWVCLGKMWPSGAGITSVSLVPRGFVALGVWQSLFDMSKRLPHPTVLGGAFGTTGNLPSGVGGWGSSLGVWQDADHPVCTPVPHPCSLQRGIQSGMAPAPPEGDFIQLLLCSPNSLQLLV